jgi:ribosomal protein S18 acetylase RimI-like enzyme
VEVRQVRPEEYEEAGAVVVAAYQALPGAHLSNGYTAQLADVGRRAREAEVLVAVDDRLLGCVTFVADATSSWAEMLESDEAAIRMLGVDPTVQGRGVGRALLGACITRACRLGRAALFLHSTPWMEAAHHLYGMAGFVRVPERDWWPVPDVPLLAFRCDLTARCDLTGSGRLNPSTAQAPRQPW